MGAAIPIITAASALVGAGASAYGVLKSSQIKTPKVEAPPAIPEEAKAEPESQLEKLKKLLSGRKQTLLTKPGSLAEPTTYRPTLLGQ